MRKLPQVLTIVLAVSGVGAAAPALFAADKDHQGHDHGQANGHHFDAHHGGKVVEVGNIHAELVMGEIGLSMYLSGHDGKAVASKGFAAMVMVLAGSERQGPFELKPAGDNKLLGKGRINVVKGARAIVTLMNPNGGGAQGKLALE